ncbi:prolyl oligopeptidase family serine peptidase [Mycolicibacterium stellerae]|uniref:prolyl oligopeptidase family serine peptidase n=1 Tax=Mycolicibacterium stellerae TaxID=2358193 RepID=UPI0013DE41CE|nr:prolyl oligopeptidase family serine peptidase [Mycolicibacterium stellerae]
MSPRRDAELAFTPPVARVADGRGGAYDWIAEPTSELIDLLDSERAYYEARVASLAELRATLTAEMTARVPATSESAPWRSGDFTYREIHGAGAEFPTLVRRTADGTDERLIDLQAVADAHPAAEFHLGECEVSPDGTTLAWSSDIVGDERYALRFRDLASGADLPGVIESTFPSGGWSADSTTYMYLRTDTINRPHQVWAHTLGADPATDRLVFTEPDERFEVSVSATRSGAWFVITAASRNTTEVHILSCAEPAGTPRLVRPRQDLVEYRLEHAPGPEGNRFLIVTNLDAESFRIVSAAVDAPDRWDDYVAEDSTTRVYQAHAFDSAVVVSARREGVGMLTVHPYRGTAFEIWPDEPGGLVTLGRNEVFDADFVTVVQQSFIYPTRWEDVDIGSGRRSPRHVEQIVGVDPDAYVQERHLAPAQDGTAVPVVVVRRRDVDLDGSPPLYLYGYGSYEACMDADFGFDWWRSLPSLLDRGVVCAFGQPRGGGELGRRWWLDGHLRAKPNTFDDQAAVADFLAGGFVDGTRIVSRGLSAGGLLQGVLYSKRPERFAGIVAEVPFVDVVATMSDSSLPLTIPEWDEWGNPADPGDRAVMESYSPVDNPPAAEPRPALLVTGAMHDTRVLVREPAKWVATLRATDPGHGAGVDRASPASRRTVLFRAETRSGAHAGPVGRYSQLDYEAEIHAWTLACLS